MCDKKTDGYLKTFQKDLKELKPLSDEDRFASLRVGQMMFDRNQASRSWICGHTDTYAAPWGTTAVSARGQSPRCA